MSEIISMGPGEQLFAAIEKIAATDGDLVVLSLPDDAPPYTFKHFTEQLRAKFGDDDTAPAFLIVPASVKVTSFYGKPHIEALERRIQALEAMKATS